MRISLKEYATPRYLHINAATNKVHLLVPIVAGEEISRDNTCKATVALREFFDGAAELELNKYKKALALDISLLEEGTALRVAKEERLLQIEAYIAAVTAMRFSYSDAIKAFLAKPSNLYSIQLRPCDQDSLSTVVNPVFNIERKNSLTGTSLSALYNAIYADYPAVTIINPEPRSRLKAAVLAALAPSPTFQAIQAALTAECLRCFNLTIDFTQNSEGHAVSKEAIDRLMGFGADATPEDYIDALLGMCARDIEKSIPTPIFYSIPSVTPENERTERLSIMTQFFLANLNVYCKAHDISSVNLGTILDASNDLSLELVRVVTAALAAGHDVEALLCDFINNKAAQFGFTRPLSSNDIRSIKQQFERTYRTVTATIENPHMDDFIILDKEATGDRAKCVTHQNAICVHFTEIMDPVVASANSDYFESIRLDFVVHPAEIPHKNACIASEDIEVPIERLLGLSDEEFEMLPVADKEACRAHPVFQVPAFLDHVAKAIPDKTDETYIKTEAEALLISATPAHRQILLRTPCRLTDYSGRVFNCTAYEYAYWAKDTHMCKMLSTYMDAETKALILARITINDEYGLSFQQHGKDYRSPHFDFTPLKDALTYYIEHVKSWVVAKRNDAIEAAWILVGKAQRDLPAHVAQEYCRVDHSFSPIPLFDEATLPRNANIFFPMDLDKEYGVSWFCLNAPHPDLGSVFGIGRGDQEVAFPMRVAKGPFFTKLDLDAMARLDKVRTDDLMHLQADLNSPESSASSGLVM